MRCAARVSRATTCRKCTLELILHNGAGCFHHFSLQLRVAQDLCVQGGRRCPPLRLRWSRSVQLHNFPRGNSRPGSPPLVQLNPQRDVQHVDIAPQTFIDCFISALLFSKLDRSAETPSLAAAYVVSDDFVLPFKFDLLLSQPMDFLCALHANACGNSPSPSPSSFQKRNASSLPRESSLNPSMLL
jgi:hypothetical protein